MADVHPFDLRSFDADAEAQADLHRLREEIRAAESERDRIRADARREGLLLGLKDAMEQAAASERARVAGEVAALAEVLRRAASAVEEQRASLVAAGERDLVKLALAVAARIVKSEVVLNRPVAAENLRHAIGLVASRRELQVLLHPDDLACVEEFLPELRREFADLRKISLEGLASVERGGVIVQTREGSVDATIDAQLEQIERGLNG